MQKHENTTQKQQDKHKQCKTNKTKQQQQNQIDKPKHT